MAFCGTSHSQRLLASTAIATFVRAPPWCFFLNQWVGERLGKSTGNYGSSTKKKGVSSKNSHKAIQWFYDLGYGIWGIVHDKSKHHTHTHMHTSPKLNPSPACWRWINWPVDKIPPKSTAFKGGQFPCWDTSKNPSVPIVGFIRLLYMYIYICTCVNSVYMYNIMYIYIYILIYIIYTYNIYIYISIIFKYDIPIIKSPWSPHAPEALHVDLHPDPSLGDLSGYGLPQIFQGEELGLLVDLAKNLTEINGLVLLGKSTGNQGLVNVPFWGYWTSPEKVAI